LGLINKKTRGTKPTAAAERPFKKATKKCQSITIGSRRYQVPVWTLHDALVCGGTRDNTHLTRPLNAFVMEPRRHGSSKRLNEEATHIAGLLFWAGMLFKNLLDRPIWRILSLVHSSVFLDAPTREFQVDLFCHVLKTLSLSIEGVYRR